jgi:hypothetical protein
MRCALLMAPAIFLLSCRTGDAPAPVTRQAEAAAVDLPDVARNLLTTRMRGHADQMAILFWSVVFLDDIGVAEIGDAIANEPKLARPLSPSEDTLNAMLPADFFVLQDELAERAKALITVATTIGHDATAIGKAYGDLATTCVKCHDKYMYGPKDRKADIAGVLTTP